MEVYPGRCSTLRIQIRGQKMHTLRKTAPFKKVTGLADERKRGTEEERKDLKNGTGTEKSDERKR